MKMNHMLFKVAQLEETLINKLEVGGTIDKIVAKAQLKTLEFFKNHPIRSHYSTRS